MRLQDFSRRRKFLPQLTQVSFQFAALLADFPRLLFRAFPGRWLSSASFSVKRPTCCSTSACAAWSSRVRPSILDWLGARILLLCLLLLGALPPGAAATGPARPPLARSCEIRVACFSAPSRRRAFLRQRFGQLLRLASTWRASACSSRVRASILDFSVRE